MAAYQLIVDPDFEPEAWNFTPPTPAVYDTTLLIPAGGASQAAYGMRLSAPVGDRIEFDRLVNAISPPRRILLKDGNANPLRQLDLLSKYIGGPFRYITVAGVVYEHNTLQLAPNGLLLSL